MTSQPGWGEKCGLSKLTSKVTQAGGDSQSATCAAKKQDMDSLSLGKSGGYVLSDLFMTLAQVLSHRYQEQKGCLSLKGTLKFLGQQDQESHVSVVLHTLLQNY